MPREVEPCSCFFNTIFFLAVGIPIFVATNTVKLVTYEPCRFGYYCMKGERDKYRFFSENEKID
jgi:hypothetical protein